MRTFIASVLVVMLGLPLSAYSQTAVNAGINSASAPGIGVAPDGKPPISNIVSRVDVLTSIPANTPVAIDLKFLRVPGVPETLTTGVTVKAYTRYVNYQNRKIGQIVLIGLEKNGRIENLPTDIYTAQFDLVKPSLDPKTDVVIKGNAGRMIEALNKLDEASKQPKKVKAATVAQNTNAQKQDGTSPTQKNDQAAAYKSPNAVKVADKPIESTRITTEGCLVRPDVKQMRAFQQSKSVTMKNGTIVSETACSDGLDSFPIEKSYAFCPYVEDLTPAVRLATAQFELIYVDATGNRQTVIPDGQKNKCAPDPQKTFPIVEKAERIFLDYANLKAVPQASLIYLNDNNREIQVRGGRASEKKLAVNMIKTTIGCGIRDDFALKTSFQLGTYTYILDGVKYQAGGCADNGTTYKHVQAFTDVSGKALCAAVLDATGRPKALQSRVSIKINALPKYITPCAPDASGAGIVATTTSCDNPALWTHDVNLGQSYGMERFYFMEGGQQVKITDCQKSQKVYPHQHQTIGWQPHDGLLYGLPLTTVYITPPTGRYDIQTNQVLSGATQMPYQLTGTKTLATGVPYYPVQDCNKFEKTEKVELWKRPDATVFNKNIGPGTLIGPTYDCSALGATAPIDWSKKGALRTGYSEWIGSQGWQGCSNTARGIQDYQATRKLIRGDGTVIKTDTKSATWDPASGGTTANAYQNHGRCIYAAGGPHAYPSPAHPSASVVSTLKSNALFLF